MFAGDSCLRSPVTFESVGVGTRAPVYVKVILHFQAVCFLFLYFNYSWMYKVNFFRFCKYALCTSNVLSCIYMLYTVLANSVNGCIVQRTQTSLPYFTSSAPLIKMVSFTSIHQLSKPPSAVPPDVRRKLLTCDRWLALCLVTCHQGIYYSLRATDSCSHAVEQARLVSCLLFQP